MLANIDIQGSGLVAASTSTSKAAGSYYFHWHRDAALTMYSLMKLNDFSLDSILDHLVNYNTHALSLQNTNAANGFDVRVEPKFTIPDGQVWTGAWCRPQIDGSALRLITLIKFADILFDSDQKDSIQKYQL